MTFLKASLRALALTVATLLPATASAQNLEFTSGSPGGAWFTQVTGLSALLQREYPGLSIRVVPGGGRDNPSKIQAGISQLGMGIDFLARAAREGTAPYEAAHDQLLSMGGTGVDVQFMVYADPAETRPLEEIFADTSIRIGVTPASTSEYLTFERILSHYGSSPEAIRAAGGRVTIASYSDLVAAYGDGQIDYVFGAGEIPSGVAAQVVAGARAARLMAFPQELMDYLTGTYGLSQSVIPAGTYPELQDADLPVAAMGNLYLVSAAVPEEVVYRLTQIIIEQHGQFSTIYAAMGNYDPSVHWQTSIPLHPGAERAFREAGFIE